MTSQGDNSVRLSGKSDSDPSGRTETQRDRDRVLYSESFRRLGGVTQVALGRPEMALHNRLTHSLKVEQVGISIYSKLIADGIPDDAADRYAIAAACLAHDLGHPPFGHAGEQELNALVTCSKHRAKGRSLEHRRASRCKKCKLEDGFEGNAQSFRILTALSTHKDPDEHLGLDLTLRTLQATTKYPWLRGENVKYPGKWGAYDCDSLELWAATGQSSDVPWVEDPKRKSLDADVMDWADDVSYAVHDIEDFYRIGRIPLNSYLEDSRYLEKFLEYAQTRIVLDDGLTTAFERLSALFPREEFEGNVSNHTELEALRGQMLTQFIDATSVVDGELRIEETQKRLNGLLKQLIWYHVIEAPALTNIQTGQRRVLREIFKSLESPALDAYEVATGKPRDPRKVRRLPSALTRAVDVTIQQQERYDAHPYELRQCVYRGLLDYISGLSDADAYEQHATLKGRPAFGRL